MTLRVQETPHDHIPEEFTIESLKAGGFTDQEIEALSTGDDPIVTMPSEEDAAKAAETAKADPAPKAEDGATAEEPDIADEPDTPPPAKAAEAAEAEQPAPVPAIEEVPDPEIPQIPDTSEAEAKVAQIDEGLNALLEKYNDGDLTDAEYKEQQKALINEQAQAQYLIQSAAQVTESAVQQAQNHWFNRLDTYKAVAPDLWSEEHLAGWDRQLKAVTGSDAYADLSRDAQIRMAHRLYAAEYEARHGKPLEIAPAGAAKPDAAKAQADDPDKLKARTDPKPEAPQTLANFNSDSTAEVEDSTFAVIDREIMKNPLGAESMFERMTPEQQERFLTEV